MKIGFIAIPSPPLAGLTSAHQEKGGQNAQGGGSARGRHAGARREDAEARRRCCFGRVSPTPCVAPFKNAPFRNRRLRQWVRVPKMWPSTTSGKCARLIQPPCAIRNHEHQGGRFPTTIPPPPPRKAMPNCRMNAHLRITFPNGIPHWSCLGLLTSCRLQTARVDGGGHCMRRCQRCGCMHTDKARPLV